MDSNLLMVLALAGASAVVGIVASIMYLVAGFREGIGWGIANLLPLGSLVFTICRWDAAKKAFLVSVVSGLLGVATYWVASEKLAGGLPLNPETIQQLASAKPQDTPCDDLPNLRNQETDLEEQIRVRTAELKAIYPVLKQKRDAIAAGDSASLKTYNEEAAIYTAKNKQLADDLATLKTLRVEIARTVEKRAQTRTVANTDS